MDRITFDSFHSIVHGRREREITRKLNETNVRRIQFGTEKQIADGHLPTQKHSTTIAVDPSEYVFAN